MTTTYPIKAPLYAITKATNYLPNVLMQMEAKEAGFDNGVFIDADGHVGESSNMNVAFVTREGALVHPKFDHILAGCTSLRLLELAPRLCDQGLLDGVEVRDITPAEARGAREMLLLGSSVKVAPIIQWDAQIVGEGKPGPVAKALLRLLDEDMRTSDRLIPVPYRRPHVWVGPVGPAGSTGTRLACLRRPVAPLLSRRRQTSCHLLSMLSRPPSVTAECHNSCWDSPC